MTVVRKVEVTMRAEVIRATDVDSGSSAEERTALGENEGYVDGDAGGGEEIGDEAGDEGGRRREEELVEVEEVREVSEEGRSVEGVEDEEEDRLVEGIVEIGRVIDVSEDEEEGKFVDDVNEAFPTVVNDEVGSMEKDESVADGDDVNSTGADEEEDKSDAATDEETEVGKGNRRREDVGTLRVVGEDKDKGVEENGSEREVRSEIVRVGDEVGKDEKDVRTGEGDAREDTTDVELDTAVVETDAEPVSADDDCAEGVADRLGEATHGVETLPVAPDNDDDDRDAEGEVVAVGVFEGAKEDERAEVLDATGDEGEGEGESCDEGVPVLDAPTEEEELERDWEGDEDGGDWDGAVVVRGGGAGSEPSDEEDIVDGVLLTAVVVQAVNAVSDGAPLPHVHSPHSFHSQFARTWTQRRAHDCTRWGRPVFNELQNQVQLQGMAEAGGGRRRTVRTYARLLLGCCAAAWRGCETLCPPLYAVRRRSPRARNIPASTLSLARCGISKLDHASACQRASSHPNVPPGSHSFPFNPAKPAAPCAHPTRPSNHHPSLSHRRCRAAMSDNDARTPKSVQRTRNYNTKTECGARLAELNVNAAHSWQRPTERDHQ
ncbi:hypothetical protein HETIRDRAFT_430473 [Heterobasidion irregulare TC 32-1]|uniref:Uncharacterized protein n=1 Tax=Heterobasidion irregulare (strain TC 32-1) TaxID=747525 RepID=W4JR68_HETIT|nr:uncharacterized protein HETIRDRAFT_430473 [Heterobasidion irregulare TC 32-1]ETW76067.1 hypothetical protein HETIRDRAFT_430473 [Heterobasidion irregulare TC 32-1]